MLWQYPEKNTVVKRTLSDINILWSDKKKRTNVDATKAIIIVKNYLKNYFCNEFYNFLLKHNESLDLINSSQKYDFAKKKEFQLTSE